MSRMLQALIPKLVRQQLVLYVHIEVVTVLYCLHFFLYI
jgi:hypothetical protein